MALRNPFEELVDPAVEKFPPSSNYDSERDEEDILLPLDEAQMKLYEACRRSGFDNSEMNRMLGKIIGTGVSEDIKVALSAAVELFIGYLSETALEVMSERNNNGTIRPEHIAESYRRLIHKQQIFKSSSARDGYLRARRLAQIFGSSSARRPFNTHDRIMQPKL